MAITQLAQGQTTLQSTAGALSTATQNLVVGSNRRMIVAVATEAVSPFGTLASPNPAVADVLPIVTWGGVPLSLLQREQDGARASTSVVNVATVSTFTITSRLSLHFFGLLESEIAGLLNNQLVMSWPLTETTVARNFRAGYWLLDDCDQFPRVRDFRTVTDNTLGPTSLAGATGPGGTSDAIILAGLKNEPTGTLQLTIDGVGLTEDFEGSFTTSGARFAGGKDLSAAALAGIPFSGTYSAQVSQGGVILTGVRLAEAFPVPASNGVAVVESLVSTVSVLAQN